MIFFELFERDFGEIRKKVGIFPVQEELVSSNTCAVLLPPVIFPVQENTLRHSDWFPTLTTDQSDTSFGPLPEWTKQPIRNRLPEDGF